jgi:hypothetical protein
MTTKILITYEGNTPLLRREVDLYHIQYINFKLLAVKINNPFHVPLLLDIKAASK